MTVDTPDMYGGAAVTTKNIVREKGKSTWTEVAGAATFSMSASKTVEVVFGEGSDDDMDEAFGCKAETTIPCDPAFTLSAVDYCKDGGKAGVIDDAVEGDVSVTIIDPEDGNTISATSLVDIDNGDVMNLKTTLQGAYEEDYGNRFTPCGNTLVYQFNKVSYTNMKATDLNGNTYPVASVPSQHAAAANYIDKAFTLPVLKSNALLEFYTVADDSGSGKEANATHGNVTFTIYDNNWFINNDVTPSAIECGPADEDGNDVGSNGSATGTIYLSND